MFYLKKELLTSFLKLHHINVRFLTLKWLKIEKLFDFFLHRSTYILKKFQLSIGLRF